MKFEVFGCPAAIATSSVMTEMATGMTVDEALRMTDEDIAERIGGLPEAKIHCSNLGAGAFHEAVIDYFRRRGYIPSDWCV